MDCWGQKPLNSVFFLATRKVFVLKLPALFVNFKVYKESFGKNAISLAKTCEAVSRETGVSVVPVVSAVDLRQVCEAVSVPVFCQHLDAVSFGKGNGKILAEAVKEAGAAGVVVNHAEDPVSNEVIEKVISRCREVGLSVMVCAEDDSRSHAVAKFNPDFVAIEPPELIGGDVSVSTADPELVKRSVKAILSVNPKIGPIMGAGVKSLEDARQSVRLGAKGLFVASGVVLAKNSKTAMLDLANGLKSGV